MELRTPVDHAIFGAFATADSVLFAVIDVDGMNQKFRIRHTDLFPFRHRTSGSNFSDSFKKKRAACVQVEVPR